MAVITDGTAVLGLGDIGPEAAMPVMEGKCALFKEFADVDAFPICIDSKNTDEIVKNNTISSKETNNISNEIDSNVVGNTIENNMVETNTIQDNNTISE